MAVLIGVICVSQGLRLLRGAGLIRLPGSHNLDAFADLTVMALYLIAVVILRISAMDRQTTQVRLRLVEATDPTPAPAPQRNDQPQFSTALLEANPLATLAVDSAGNVVYWNHAAERLFGWRAEDVIGRASPLSDDGTILTKAGTEIAVETWTAPLRSLPGSASGTLLTFVPVAIRTAASKRPMKKLSRRVRKLSPAPST